MIRDASAISVIEVTHKVQDMHACVFKNEDCFANYSSF